MTETLFSLLDAALLADTGPAGFTARIAFGVRGPERMSWWIGDVGAEVSTSRSHDTPADCGAVLILGEEEAQRIIDSPSLPQHPRLFQAFGDTALLARFKDRYLDRKNVLGLRLARAGVRSPR